MRIGMPSVRTIAWVVLVTLAVMIVAHFGILAAMPTGSCHVSGEPVVCVVSNAVGDLILTTPIVLFMAVVVFLVAGADDVALRARVAIAIRSTALAPIAIRAPAARALARHTNQRTEAPYSCHIRTGIGA